MEEIWKKIPTLNGDYEASNLGRVKSKVRKFVIMDRVLTESVGTHGYMVVGIRINKSTKAFPVHQLVAMAFLGSNFSENKLVVDHIDNNKLNNNLTNLHLVTFRYNVSKGKSLRTYSSKYTGVSWWKNMKKWVAESSVNGKRKYIGSFNSEIEAHNSYIKYLKENTNEKF